MWQVVMIIRNIASKEAAVFVSQVLRREWDDEPTDPSDNGVTIEVQEQK